MKSTTLSINSNDSAVADFARIIVSVRNASSQGSSVVIGYSGRPNVEQVMKIGDAVLFETPNNGVIEVRALSMSAAQVKFLITEVEAASGVFPRVANDSATDAPFSLQELEKISLSMESLREAVRQDRRLSTEQFDLFSRKLDELQSAATRYSKKDWMNYVSNSLTSLFITASFTPSAVSGVISAAERAFSWLFTSGLLLPS